MEIRNLARDAVRRLLQVKRQALAEPLRMHMGIWLQKKTDVIQRRALKYPPCGTVGCIGGWIEFNAGERRSRSRFGEGGVWKKSQQILGITDDQTEELFYPPLIFQQGQNRHHAQAVARLIDRFIKKYSSGAVAAGRR
jgi:hypothetical protein